MKVDCEKNFTECPLDKDAVKQIFLNCLDDPDVISDLIGKVTPVVRQIPVGNSSTITGADEQELVSFSYTPKFANSTVQVTAHYFSQVSESPSSGAMGFVTRLRSGSATGTQLDLAFHGGSAEPSLQTDNGTLVATVVGDGNPLNFVVTGKLDSGATEGLIRDVDVVIVETPNS
jgi:hypothetical protein